MGCRHTGLVPQCQKGAMLLWFPICLLYSVPGQTCVPWQDHLCLGRMLAAGAEELLENLSWKPSSTSLLQAEESRLSPHH